MWSEANLPYMVKRGLLKARTEGLGQVASLIARDAKTRIQLGMVQAFPWASESFYPQLNGVFLEATNKCNLHCKMCSRGSRVEGFMDYGLWERLVDEIADVGNVSVVLHMGGESLVHPFFTDMLECVMKERKRLRRVGFVTNGTLLSDKIQRKLIDLQVDWITVSLDGLGRVNDAIRIGSKYEQIEANIKGLLEKRGEKLKPEVGLSLTDVGQSRSEIDDFIRAWVQVVDHIRVAPSQDMKDNRLMNRDYFAGLDIRENEMCFAPFSAMTILWNGDVVGCCTDINGMQVLGNVQRSSLLEVWEGIGFRKFRKDLATHHVESRALCRTCELWKPVIRCKPLLLKDYSVRYDSFFKFYQRTKAKA